MLLAKVSSSVSHESRKDRELGGLLLPWDHRDGGKPSLAALCMG